MIEPARSTASRSASPLRRTVAALVLLAGLAGCGGSSGASGTSTPASTAAKTTTQTTTPTTQPVPAATPLAQAKKRLQAAGYTVEDGNASGTAVDSLTVTDAPGVDISAYSSSADAQKQKQAVSAAFASNPGRGAAQLVGLHLYFTGKARNLTSQERATFKKIVATAEGK